MTAAATSCPVRGLEALVGRGACDEVVEEMERLCPELCTPGGEPWTSWAGGAVDVYDGGPPGAVEP